MEKNLIKLISLVIFYPLISGGVEFRDASFEPVKGYSEMTYDVGSEKKKVFVASETLIDSTAIEEAYVTSSGTSTDHLGKTETLYGVALVFTDVGAEEMKKITESRISKPLAILLDGEVLSAPVVRANIGKRATISGSGSEAEAEVILHKIIESFDTEKRNSAQVLATRASLAMKGGDSEAALELLKNATTKKPNVADYWMELGAVQNARNENEEAIDSFSKALKLLQLEPEQRPVDQVLLLLMMGRDKDAKELFSAHAPELKETHPGLSYGDLLEIRKTQFQNK